MATLEHSATQHNDRMSQRAHLRAWFRRHRTDFTVLRHLLTLRIFTERYIVLRNVWQQHKTEIEAQLLLIFFLGLYKDNAVDAFLF